MQQQVYEAQEYATEGMAADAHLHLDLFEDPEATVKAAREAGVGILVSAGSNYESNKKNAKIANGGIYAVVGIDPEFALTEDAGVLEKLEDIITNNSNIIGIGEIGLDYKKAVDDLQRNRQKMFFERQLEIAQKMDLPVVVHSRNSFDDVIEIIRSYKVRVMFHYFEGGKDDAALAEKFGIISVPPFDSKKRRAAIKAVGIGSIVAETDSPVVGKTPSDVFKSIAIIAAARGISYEEAIARTTENLRNFFRI